MSSLGTCSTRGGMAQGGAREDKAVFLFYHSCTELDLLF